MAYASTVKAIGSQTQTTPSFNDMLKDYLPYDLLMEEMLKRDYFLSKVDMDNKWKGGVMQVPFLGAKASSVRVGKLVAQGNITQDKPVLGQVNGYKEVWGAMIFNDHDLKRHDDMKQSFIKVLPDKIDTFVDSMKEKVSHLLLSGQNFATVAAGGAANAATGRLIVDRIERFEVGMYVEIALATPVNGVHAGFVSSVNMNTNEVLIVTAMSDVDAGTNPVDLTAVVAESGPGVFDGTDAIIAGSKFYLEGVLTSATTHASFTSLASQLLPASAGGSVALFGVTKTKYPILQAQAFNGAAGTYQVTSATILDVIFDAWLRTKQIGKGAPAEAIMSYKLFALCMKKLEKFDAAGSSTGSGRQYTSKDAKANVFGWSEITVNGPKGELKLVAINEMDDDKIFFIDWRGIKMHTNGMFERRVSPNGNEFYEIRAETGYQYIVDIRFFGELVVSRPSYCGIIYGINV